MRRLLPILLALLIAAPAAAETLAITGVTAWSMTGPRPVEDATILVADGRIASVVAHGAVPAGARIVKGKGRIVTPGLIAAATQIGLGEVGGTAEEGSAGVAKGPLGAAFDLSYAVDANALTVQQARADGLAWAFLYPSGSAGAPVPGEGAGLRIGPAGAPADPLG